KRNLIYKEDNVVNWCPTCASCVADMELKLVETTEKQHSIDIKIDTTITTLIFTQPEMFLGATGIGITKSHENYNILVGQNIWIPILNKKLKIYEVSLRSDINFNKNLRLIVPSYNVDDFNFAKKNKISIEKIYEDNGTIKFNCSSFSIKDIRSFIIKQLKKENINYSFEKFGQGKMIHSLCDTTIVPLIKSQWYMKMYKMEPKAREVFDKNKTLFSHDFWKKGHLGVLNNIVDSALPNKEKWWEGACVGVAQGYSSNKDWVISRQNWWGQPIPVWYCNDCMEMIVDSKEPVKCTSCQSLNIYRDKDVLDVWFSCALWPISVNPFDARGHFVDISIMGSDIFYFWVASSNMICQEIYGKEAFKKAFVHGLLCDKDGKKMSKSLGNVISMENIIDKYGAETLRSFVFGLMEKNSGTQWLKAGNNDISDANINVNKIYKKLIEITYEKGESSCDEIKELKNSVSTKIDEMRIGEAYNLVLIFINNYSLNKIILNEKSYLELLLILHPFHPFISNYIYKSQLNGKKCLSEIYFI
ncbi:MAG TPA: hypothetical protein EYG89_04785, partial [Bacteroidia bacterium]|nr:hypothetical protein [Bacteroidia bacterium]